MIIIHKPSQSDIENQYGYWLVVGDTPAGFNQKGLPVYQATPELVYEAPFAVSQVRYWEGPPEEMAAFLRRLKPGVGQAADLGRALFG